MNLPWHKVKSKLGRYFLPGLSILLIIIFFRWVLTTFLPVIYVEVRYQYQQVLTSVFHVSSLKDLFLPDFSGMTTVGLSQNREYGISIPAIYLDEPVVFNVDPNDVNQYTAALKKGIAHASSTSFPDHGGLGYYFAHSSSGEIDLRNNAIFFLLGKLQEGDSIYIWHHQRKFEYQVTGRTVVGPKDLDFLYQPYDRETIVLQTCWPPGSDAQRLLVFAVRTSAATSAVSF